MEVDSPSSGQKLHLGPVMDCARSLLGGTFHEIKLHIRIINWQEIVKLYKLLRDTTELEKQLRI